MVSYGNGEACFTKYTYLLALVTKLMLRSNEQIAHAYVSNVVGLRKHMGNGIACW